ncbi:hypothetical protein ACFC34_41400 [Streptomyces sp. NPDC056053]|uniref:hypothetical protein n=1 Tax=Streptomyces sp. NPDC056053 TaxID=3345696 RepID=UPI0035E2EB30
MNPGREVVDHGTAAGPAAAGTSARGEPGARIPLAPAAGPRPDGAKLRGGGGRPLAVAQREQQQGGRAGATERGQAVDHDTAQRGEAPAPGPGGTAE